MKTNDSRRFQVGTKVVCTKSASCGYKEGREYEVYLNNSGVKCLKGDDGYEDIISMMVSAFKPTSDKPKNTLRLVSK